MGGGGRGDRPPPAYLKVWMTAPHPPSSYLKVWLTRVVFKLGSKVNCVCYGLATPHGDWLHSFFFIRIYFIKISRLKFANFKNILRIKPRL